MKYISKELGTQKQYQELLACLDENSPCNPRDTAETMLKIVCRYRIRNSAYSENLMALHPNHGRIGFAVRQKTQQEILLQIPLALPQPQ